MMNVSIKTINEFVLHNEGLRKLFKYRHSIDSGGKAGKGGNKTTSFTLSSEKIMKFSPYFSYVIGDQNSMDKAVVKSINWLEETLIANGRCPHCGDGDCGSDHK